MNYKIKKSCNKQEWKSSCYQLSKGERIGIILEVVVVLLLLAYCFYQSMLALPFLAPIGIFYYKRKRVTCYEKKKSELEIQFKEMITMISASLRAGYSMENACRESLIEIKLLYGERGMIYEELQVIVKKLNNNQSVESLFFELAEKLQIKEVKEFAEILIVAKKYGGDLSKIIQNTSELISEKIEVNREIQTVISGKQGEQDVMNMMPIGIICYMNVTSPDYLDPLYHNIVGIMAMSVCCIIYVLAYIWSQKILRIRL
ncbi:MAG: hypothetical protein R3Y54_00915 [Eubacteriales bacterium]